MRLLEKVLDKHRPGWRERGIRRKSIWHLPKILASFILLGVIWYLLFRCMWEIHLIVYPGHEGYLGEFWQEGISLKSFISSFLMIIPLFLPAMGASFILVNLIFWFIPPARKAFECEAAGDREMTFNRATSALSKVFVKYLLPIGLGLSLLGRLRLPLARVGQLDDSSPLLVPTRRRLTPQGGRRAGDAISGGATDFILPRFLIQSTLPRRKR